MACWLSLPCYFLRLPDGFREAARVRAGAFAAFPDGAATTDLATASEARAAGLDGDCSARTRSHRRRTGLIVFGSETFVVNVCRSHFTDSPLPRTPRPSGEPARDWASSACE